MENNKTQKEFYGMVTYVDVMGRGDGMKNFYDDRELYDADIAHQKSRNTGNYGTELTREQFIEEMANALEIQGHSFSIGSTLKGNYAEEIAVWKKNNPNAVSVHPELAEINRKAETVYNWEVANNVVDTTTSLDKHTGQIFIDDYGRFEDRYLQLQEGQKAAETMKGIKESAERQKQAVAEQNSEAGAAEKKISEYRGFAYTKNSKKPQIVYGNSKEDILNLLRKWNQTRTPGYTYDTCNIGKYNPETEKHENYRKIEVATGKDIGNIYLKMPKNLSKTEFNDTIQYFKESGARYNIYAKEWYITPELKDKFLQYLPENTEKMSEVQESPVEQAESLPTEPEKASALNYITGIDRQYVLDLKNGETLHVGEDEVLRRAGVSQEELSAGKIIEALEGKVQEHMQLFAQDSYDISVSSEFYDNRCTIWMHNGQSIDLYGDQYGVHFPTMEAKEISEIVSNYMKLQEKAPVSELKEGAEVTFYVPDYEVLPNGIKDIVGIKEVAGTLQEISADKYVVQEATGNSTEVLRENIYDERQAVIMQKAVSKSFSAEQMDLVGQPRLSAAQMEQVFNGIQDKLSIYQVALYANPSIEAWQMDIYRYGMGNGIHFDDVKEIIQNNSMKPTSWEDSRNMVDKMVKAQRNLIIKDLKKNGLNPEKQLVRKFEKLNGMTGKMYSVEEVKKALKENSGNVPEDRISVLKDIGKEINYQKNRALRPMAAAAQVPLR